MTEFEDSTSIEPSRGSGLGELGPKADSGGGAADLSQRRKVRNGLAKLYLVLFGAAIFITFLQFQFKRRDDSDRQLAWEAYSPQLLKEYRQETTPILIYFESERELDNVALLLELETPELRRVIREQEVRYIRLASSQSEDDDRVTDPIAQAMEAWQLQEVPCVIYRGESDEEFAHFNFAAIKKGDLHRQLQLPEANE